MDILRLIFSRNCQKERHIEYYFKNIEIIFNNEYYKNEDLSCIF